MFPFADHNTNNLVERQFRSIKEEVLGRKTAYNAAHLAKVLVTDYEQTMRLKVVDYANGRRCLPRKVMSS